MLGDYLVGQELKHVANALPSGAVFGADVDRLVDQLAMHGDVRCSASVAGGDENRLFFVKVLPHVGQQLVDHRVHCGCRLPGKHGREQFVGVGKQHPMSTIDCFVAAFVG